VQPSGRLINFMGDPHLNHNVGFNFGFAHFDWINAKLTRWREPLRLPAFRGAVDSWINFPSFIFRSIAGIFMATDTLRNK
jgi:hypothetical protein